MIEDPTKIFKFFEEFSPNVKSKVNLYVIGGAALMIRGLKPATKDIDIVVRSRKEFDDFHKSLIEDGFKSKELGPEYNHFHLAEVLQKDDYRIDLFLDCVCAKLRLTDSIASRAEKVYESGKLSVLLCSNTDIFLFKSITDRDGDKEDCISMARLGIDWKAFVSEVKEQKKFLKAKGKYGDRKVTWFALIPASLELFQTRGVIIPKSVFDEFQPDFFED